MRGKQPHYTHYTYIQIYSFFFPRSCSVEKKTIGRRRAYLFNCPSALIDTLNKTKI